MNFSCQEMYLNNNNLYINTLTSSQVLFAKPKVHIRGLIRFVLISYALQLFLSQA